MTKGIDISSVLIYNCIRKLDILTTSISIYQVDRRIMINIKEKRKQANITQSELAASIGVGQSAVAMWETGASHPRVELLPKIASVLNCTVDDLLR